MTASNNCCTPLFLKADPQSTGVIFIAIVPARIARLISSSDSEWPFKYFSMTCSSNSATAFEHFLAILFGLVEQIGGNFFDLIFRAQRLVVIK